MAEIGGALLGYAVTKLLDEVLIALRHLKNGPTNASKLQKLLERLQPSVEQLCSFDQHQRQHADKWLTELHGQLEKARALINASGDFSKNIIKRYRMSKDSLELYGIIQGLLQEASVLQLASGMSMQVTFSDIDAKILAKVKALEGVEGLEKIADLSSKSDILSALFKVEHVLSAEGFDEPSSSTAPIEAFRTDSVCIVPKPQVTFGGEDVANELSDHLLSEGCKRWVGLWGMGGIGKTFTAKKVFHDSRVQRHFSGGTFWLTVSKDQADPDHLLKQLCMQLKGPTSIPQLRDNLEDAKFYVKSRLDQERVLLVLDDVWHNEVLEYWDVILENIRGVILVTTRDQGILRKVLKLVKIFEVSRLSSEDSWKLFSYYACRNGGGVVPLEVDAIAKKMAEECRGLPLALEVIGSTMADKQLLPAEKALGQTTLRVWERALKQLKDANHAKNEYEALYLKLQLSIESLAEQDSRLQDCFFYLAAFPEDYKIKVTLLVWMWTAEGLVHDDANSSFSAEEEGRILLGLLATKSMMEVSEDGWFCRIHDVLRDLALRNLNWNILKGEEIRAPARQCLYAPGLLEDKLPGEWTLCATPSSAKRLSFQGNALRHFPEPKHFHAPHLQVLILSENSSLESLSPSFFPTLSELKVLDLSGTSIKRIPGTLLRRLKSLVLLNLSACHQLQEVSEEIDDLQNLGFLDLRDCISLQKLPRVNNLRKLKSYLALVPLGEAEMDVQDGSQCWQSCGLWRTHRGCLSGLVPYLLPPNLRRLDLHFWHTSKYHFHVSSLGLLEELRLWSSSEMAPSLEYSIQSILAGGTQCHQLKILETSRCYGRRLLNLGTLCLSEDLTGMKSFGHEGLIAFPSLKRLDISRWPSMEKMFIFRQDRMPKIESLFIMMTERENFPTAILELHSLRRLLLILYNEQTSGEDVEFVFKQPGCFPHLESLIIQVAGGQRISTLSQNLPEHILDRQRQGLLTIHIR